jgi:hypothetical protein
MIDTKWWRAISIASVVFTGLFLMGFLKAFNVEFGQSLWGTGLTPEILFGLSQGILLYAIWKNRL